MSKQGISGPSALERVKTYSTILATIAVPLIVAYFGSRVELAILESNSRSAFVRLAVDVLSEEDQDPRLREWASLLLEQTSPVPFSPEILFDFATGSVVLVTTTRIPPELLNSTLMNPPDVWKELDTQKPITNAELLENYLENKLISEQNTLRLEHLQQLIRDMAALER